MYKPIIIIALRSIRNIIIGCYVVVHKEAYLMWMLINNSTCEKVAASVYTLRIANLTLINNVIIDWQTNVHCTFASVYGFYKIGESTIG